jgi:hypothetical protein
MFCRLEGFYKERRSAAASKIWTFLPPGTIYSALGPEALAPIFVNTGLKLPRRPPSSLLKIAMQPAKKKTAPCNKHLLAVVHEGKKTAMQPVKKKTAMQPAKKKTAPCDKHSLAVVCEGKKTAMQPVKKKTAMQPAKKKTAMKPVKKKNSVMQQALAGSRKKSQWGRTRDLHAQYG